MQLDVLGPGGLQLWLNVDRFDMNAGVLTTKYCSHDDHPNPGENHS
jgi:hypothetical protein